MSESPNEKLQKIKEVLKDFFQLLDKDKKQQLPLSQFLQQLQQLGIQFNSEQKKILIAKLCDSNNLIQYNKALDCVSLNEQGLWVVNHQVQTPLNQLRLQNILENDRVSRAGSVRSQGSRRSYNLSNYSKSIPYENLLQSENESSLQNARLLISQGVTPHDLYFIWGNFIKCDAQQRGELSKVEFLSYLEQYQVSWFQKKFKQEALEHILQVCSRDDKVNIHKISNTLDAMHKCMQQQATLKEKLTQRSSMYQILSPHANSQIPETIEFLRKLLINRIQLRFRQFKQAFAVFDQNKDGKITPEEFLKGIQWLQLDDQMNHQQIATLYTFLDKSKNGFLTYEQFSNLFCEEMKPQALTSREQIINLPKISREIAGITSRREETVSEVMKPIDFQENPSTTKMKSINLKYSPLSKRVRQTKKSSNLVWRPFFKG